MSLSVLTVARTLPHHIRGGMEESAWSLATAMAGLGVKTTVLTTSFDGTGRAWSECGVTFHEIPYVPDRLRSKPPHRWWSRFGRAASRFAANRRLSADVVHVHSMYANGFLGLSPRPPVVVTIHGTPRRDYLAATRDALIREVGRVHPRVVVQRLTTSAAETRMRAQLARADAVVPVSEFVASTLPGVRRGDPRIHVIPNGIDPANFPIVSRASARASLGLALDVSVILFLGRIEEYKGVGRLIDAMEAIPGAILLVAGDGPYLAAVRAKAASSRAQGRIRILGAVTDALRPMLFAASDLFCLPSRNEGQPISLLESLAMGTPIATTQEWFPPDLRRFAVTGQDVRALIESGMALSQTLDPLAVRETVLSRFTWTQVARKYLDLFENLRRAQNA